MEMDPKSVGPPPPYGKFQTIFFFFEPFPYQALMYQDLSKPKQKLILTNLQGLTLSTPSLLNWQSHCLKREYKSIINQ